MNPVVDRCSFLAHPVHSGAIEVPLALARVVGLAAALDSDTYLSVRVEPAGFVPTASRVCLEPLSSDDWEILEANAEHLEGQMLTQVCVPCLQYTRDSGAIAKYWRKGGQRSSVSAPHRPRAL